MWTVPWAIGVIVMSPPEAARVSVGRWASGVTDNITNPQTKVTARMRNLLVRLDTV